MGKSSRRDRQKSKLSPNLCIEERRLMIKSILTQMSSNGLDVAKEEKLRDFLQLCQSYIARGERTEINISINNDNHRLVGILPSKRTEAPVLKITQITNTS